MEKSENRDLTMAGVTDQNTFFELQKAQNPSKYWGFVVPVVGLEPTRMISPTDFESVTSANSITPANLLFQKRFLGNRRSIWRSILENRCYSVFKKP